MIHLTCAGAVGDALANEVTLSRVCRVPLVSVPMITVDSGKHLFMEGKTDKLHWGLLGPFQAEEVDAFGGKTEQHPTEKSLGIVSFLLNQGCE